MNYLIDSLKELRRIVAERLGSKGKIQYQCHHERARHARGHISVNFLYQPDYHSEARSSMACFTIVS